MQRGGEKRLTSSHITRGCTCGLTFGLPPQVEEMEKKSEQLQGMGMCGGMYVLTARQIDPGSLPMHAAMLDGRDQQLSLANNK